VIDLDRLPTAYHAPAMRCGRRKCGRPAITYACGEHVCAEHVPTGSPSSSHSLLGDAGRCSYCGAVVTPWVWLHTKRGQKSLAARRGALAHWGII
jgi:hypothetical protein